MSVRSLVNNGNRENIEESRETEKRFRAGDAGAQNRRVVRITHLSDGHCYFRWLSESLRRQKECGKVGRRQPDVQKVAQQNSAHAEESAASSEELNAQAEQMESIVMSLVRLVGGRKTDGDEPKKISYEPCELSEME
jgi:methyl-accepting chemotaxis protein